jgi:hypothetical protein
MSETAGDFVKSPAYFRLDYWECGGGKGRWGIGVAADILAIEARLAALESSRPVQPATVSDAQPAAWGILRVGGRFVDICGSEHHAASSRVTWDAAENWLHEVVPLSLYTAPQPAIVSDAQAARDQDRAVVQQHCAAEQAADAPPAAPQPTLTDAERHFLERCADASGSAGEAARSILRRFT